jgi:hypothetical protein
MQPDQGGEPITPSLGLYADGFRLDAVENSLIVLYLVFLNSTSFKAGARTSLPLVIINGKPRAGGSDKPGDLMPYLDVISEVLLDLAKGRNTGVCVSVCLCVCACVRACVRDKNHSLNLRLVTCGETKSLGRF